MLVLQLADLSEFVLVSSLEIALVSSMESLLALLKVPKSEEMKVLLLE